MTSVVPTAHVGHLQRMRVRTGDGRVFKLGRPQWAIPVWPHKRWVVVSPVHRALVAVYKFRRRTELKEGHNG